MKVNHTLLFAIGLTLFGTITHGKAYDALQRPTELQYWDAARADSGYNFYGVGGTSYLLDMEGRVVHTWPIGNNPHLLDNGGILDAATNDPSGFSGFKEVSWDGATVWTYLETRSTYHPHHDFTRIYNPKLGQYTNLYIANKDLTYAQLIAAGADPARTPASGAQMDAIVEVDSSGTIIWEWCFFDHLVQDFDATKPNHVGTGKAIADYPKRLNINLPGHNLKNDWLHCNSLDYNQSLDQIVVNSVQGEFYVIDHGNTFVTGDPAASIALAATAAGDFLYRFGDPVRYDQGTKPSILEDWTQSTTGTKQLGGAHHIQWIPAGVPGAGNFLIFNNGEYLSEHTSQSYVMEINPYLDAGGTNTGHYVNPPDAGYNTVTPPAVTDKAPKQISKQVVWNYSSKSNLTLYSNIGCGAQRLPNGNTLICADTYGYVMEVTPAGDTVWDYIMPVTKDGNALVLGDRLPMVNSIFRAFRYKSTHPALAGRTLTPGATAAGRTTVDNPYAGTTSYQALQRATETQYWDATNAFNGYTFFCAQGTSYLIDMQGRLTKTWATGTDARLLDSGHVLDWNASTPTGLRELDWNGNLAWQHTEARSTYHPHGDFKRIYNPKLGAYTTLFLANKDLTAAECIAAGCDPADAPYSGAQVDAIVEVDMSGNVIWEWSFWDHAVQTIDNTKANYVTNIANHPGKIHLNLPGRPLRANWLDCNSLDYNQSRDQIVVNCRQGEFYIIDHGNTFMAGNPTGSIALAASATGDFLYRFGDPARYGKGSPPSVNDYWQVATSGNKQIGGSSNAQWIGAGLPGAGRLLVFSNNQYLYQRTPQSYVLEINPFLNSSKVDTGAYVDPPTALYDTWTFDKDTMKANQSMSRQIVWNYASVSNLTLFSHFGSSAQRLPNGNTLVCATTEGYFVEVDASGNVVWEYINPVTGSGIATALGDRLPMTNAVPRAARYAANFAGFDGHVLTPGATIAGNQGPVIAATTRTPAVPSASDPVWVTSRITDDGGIASATLTYSTGSGSGTTDTVFTETMAATAAKPWTGGGTTNAWTVTGSNFEQRTGANYGTGSPCGLEFKAGATVNPLSAAMVATTNAINAAGTAGYVEFWIQTLTLSSTAGWAFQVSADGDTTYTTRLSELTGSSHAWQKYHYDLSADELRNTLKLRFQFTGGGAGSDHRIDLDQITVTVTSGGASGATVAMLDDGLHHDGAAGDHLYGAQIPAMADGAMVSYFVSATDSAGATAVDPATAPGTSYSYTVGSGGTPPVISDTARSPLQPTAADSVWVTGTLTDDGSIGTASLTYASSGTAGDTTVFTETMTANAVKPWTGSGAVNAWTVTGSNFEQRTGANYGTGNVCGLEYKGGTTLNPLTSAMVATTNAINATGSSAYVEFWVQTLTLDGTDGWAFQVDAGSGYVTRLSELTGNSHAWQKYHYDLAPGELVGTLRLRFQFTGGGSSDDDRINLDQITVVTQAAGGTAPVTVAMLDDGAHQDGAAGDHVYGAQIPAMASGTTVTYYVTAIDNEANTVTDPATAPGTTYSYTVGSGTTTQTVGLFTHDPAKACPGFTLFAPKHNTRTYLIDNYGRVVHSWTKSPNVPGQSVYLRENGNLLRTCMTMGALSSGGGEGGRLEEYDWNDNLVWELDYSTASYMSHHDVAPLPNGNVLMLVVEKRTTAEVLAAGFNPALLDSQITTKGYMLPDTVVEIAPTGASGGIVVWQWKVWDHLVQNFDPTKANYNATPNAHPELVNPNAYTETGRIMQFWNHMNSISYNATHDQIMLSVRGSSELWVIDHSTTTAEAAGHSGGNRGKGGDLLYRWGNPVTYGAGTAASQMYFDQHDTHWIEDGCPGAGNIIAFNNGIGRNYSSIDEFVSPMLADGSYPLTAGSPYAPSALSWTYVASPPASLYSEAISGAQRLPNGNTLICDGVHGVFTEVTTAGEVVWKYVNSEVKDGTTPSEILYQGQEPALDDRGHLYNAVFKIHRYPADYAAFAGRTLTPGAQLELYSSPTIAGTAHTPAAPTAADPVWVTATITDDTSVTSVTLAYIVNGAPTTVTMFDDGAHQDGIANDHIYGAQIPAQSAGSTVRYYLTATDSASGVTKDPVAAPTVAYTYAVSGYGTTTGWTMLALPDTGQTGNYTSTAGEDSDYTIRAPSFTDNGNGTATDTVTGLMWQQVDGGEMTWENANAYATALTLGGHSDWRLPFSHELFSILNHGKINPALDTTIFPASAAQYWWSADTGADDSTRVWAANAGGGIGPHPKTETLSAGGSKRFHVLCVRDTRPSTVTRLAHSFTVGSDGMVTDNHTGLVWQQVPAASAMTWEDALAYAEGLSLGGRDDWRLPNIKELRSICDDSRVNPALDTTAFPGSATARYWSSTTQINAATQAWLVEARTGLVAYDNKTATCTVRCVRGGIPAEQVYPDFALIPSGQFEMGDHFDLGGAEHASDEIPLHTVAIDAFTLGKTEITNQQYLSFLESALAAGLIEVRNGYAYAAGGSEILCETAAAASYSGIAWSGTRFSVVAGREAHPMVGVRWLGAAAYCNWLSSANGYTACYNITIGTCDFTKTGYRLPTEAEWEYAANGGRYYSIFPWGNDTNTSGTLANWPNSGDPYETGDLPWTTPVGFYNGQLHTKADFNWPGAQATYQTSNATNGYGLHDMSGNVWEWCNDWYGRGYYSVSPADNPQGPATGDPMPDGKPYRVLRGGNWFNGEQYYGHGRLSNRNPGYYRGPQDPNHPYYHVGFRVARPATSVGAGVTEPGASLVTRAGGLGFCEGPAADAGGNVYFSNMAANRIMIWSTEGALSTFRENAGGANGLFFYGANLLACEGTNGRVVRITMGGDLTVMADTYAGKRFNQPNDLWIDPKGGVYFSDPVYGGGTVVQGGEHVYYLSPDRTTVTRVVSDMVRPNGLIGPPDGQTLYVSDHGAGAVYRYTIQPDGSLTGKTLFASVASDGMTIDSEGNIYLTATAVLAYSPGGLLLEEIAVPERPTNATFGGVDLRSLFITTEGGLYSIRTRVQGNVSNFAPVFSGYALDAVVDTPLSLEIAKILARASDPDGDALSLARVFSPSARGGTVTLTNAVNYTPPAGYVGVDSFEVEVIDSHGAPVRGIVTIAVNAESGGTGQNQTYFALHDGKAEMIFRGIPGRSYTIQRSTDMAIWEDLATLTAGADGKIPYIDSSPPLPQAFYRTRSN